MTKIKKIVAATVAALTIGTIGTGAYASTYALPKNKYPFDFTFMGHGGIQETSEVVKTNSSGYNAKVQVTGGYVSEDAYITINVSYYPMNSTTRKAATDSVQITSPVGDFSLRYTDPRGEGSKNLLVGFGSYYGAEVSGTWEP